MDINFNFLNFCSRYSVKGSIDRRLASHACFSTVFGDPVLYMSNTYKLIIYKPSTSTDNNKCFLTKEELINHIEEGKNIHTFSYTLKENEKFYSLIFTLEANKIYHKTILTWLRYCYEFPFNVALKDAYKLKNVRGFKRITSFNLVHIIGASMGIDDHGVDIHAIGDFSRMKSLQTWRQLKTELKKGARSMHSRVNDLVKYAEGIFEILDVEEEDLKHSSYWENEKELKKRKKVYINNYKKIKEG